jgi:flavin reductase (DIM6/NTAB) family NADH-FMN oxidoreductase RutF
MKYHQYSLADITQLDKPFRRNLINSISGFKAASLVGTRSLDGKSNLALFSSTVHIGADPPLQGLIFRPDSVDRHTLENIRSTGYYTINQVSKNFTVSAHQTSARFARDESEFEATGLNEEWLSDFTAPFVQESAIKFGLHLVEEVPIKTNGTYLIVGEVQKLWIREGLVAEDGWIDLEKARTITISGLDSYYETRKIHRLSYAKSDRQPEELN